MQGVEWVVRDSVLVLSVDYGKTIIIPNANDIFATEFKNKIDIKGYNVTPPSNSLVNITFSKYPIVLKINVFSDIEKNIVNEKIFKCTVTGIYNNLEVDIPDPITRKSDHIIYNNTWYPFAKGYIEEVRKIFSEGDIVDVGPISLRQYFYLLQKNSDIIKIEFRESKNSIKDLSSINIPDTYDNIPGFNGTLYPYQIKGYNWLRMIDKEDLGCILADEMGLGKTIQIICLILKNISENKHPSLIVCPATLLENWRREFKKFSPEVKTSVHQGHIRTAFYSDFLKFDVVITSYDIIIRDLPIFKMIKWNMIVLDEAQAIKNSDALRTIFIKEIPRRVSIAVTGTPIENRLTDLWSILDFAIPGFLGDKTEFEKKFPDTTESALKLEPLISPIILKRTIKTVANDLPERVDIPQVLDMTEDMISEYETIRKNTMDDYEHSGGLIALIKLRMFCTHPLLIKESNINPADISPKYTRLLELLDEIIENKSQVLIFTSFSKMIDIFISDLTTRYKGVPIDWIDGRVPMEDRQNKVDKFNNCNCPAILILNPKAAGTGLNLTGANHVIHYNLEWNPAIEDQASARVYRRGQNKPVTIHRLYYKDTIEEIINDRLERKRILAKSAIIGTTGVSDDYIDIMRALKITPFKKR